MAQQLPDAEILFRTWALSQTPITDLVDTRIATRLPTSGTMPFLVYTANHESKQEGMGQFCLAAYRCAERFLAGKYGIRFS